MDGLRSDNAGTLWMKFFTLTTVMMIELFDSDDDDVLVGRACFGRDMRDIMTRQNEQFL